MSDQSDFDGSGTHSDPMVLEDLEGGLDITQSGDDQSADATSRESTVASTVYFETSTAAAAHDSSQSSLALSADTSAASLASTSSSQDGSVAPSMAGQVGPIVPAGTVGKGPGNQYRRIKDETFTLDPNDSNWIIARVSMENPYAPGTYYEQEDRIPVLDTSARSPDNPTFYFIPDLKAAKIPMRHRASTKNKGQPDQWVRTPNSDEWTRRNKDGTGIDTWRPTVLFRRFNQTTNKYEEIYLNEKKLADIDPNEKSYQYGYNKWIDQIIRRRDSKYVKVMHKDHWTVKERQVLFDGVNDYVRRNGLRRFGFEEGVKLSREEMLKMTNAVNAVGGKNRQVDAVRGQIHTSHPRKNKAIFDLLARARDMRQRLARGEKVPRAERYPDKAIPQKDYPQEPGAKKRHLEELNETDSDREDQPLKVESPPSVASSSPIESDNKHVKETDELDEFWKVHGRQPAYKPMQPNKKLKTEDASGKEIMTDDMWADTDEEIMSDAAEQAKEEAQWETCDEASPGEGLEGETFFEEDLQDNTPAEITTGIATPGVDFSDSESDDEVTKAAHLLQLMQRDQQRPQVVANAAAASPQQRKRKRGVDIQNDGGNVAYEASGSPASKKRKPTPETEMDGSDGDDEKELPSPQRRVIKKTRMART